MLQLLGEGQWTRAYLARPANGAEAGDADYVIKILKAPLHDDPTAIDLLRREADVAGEIQHVNVGSVLACQLGEPPFFLVTPWLPGATLAQLIRELGPLSTPHAVWIARQAASGLQALHHRGWRHGDVKPSNILVSMTGHVTLLDLGFAERIGKPGRPDCVKVSPAYGAPELFQACAVCNGASDVYALGITLFEMLTGRRPFNASDWRTLTAEHRATPPDDIRRYVPQLPLCLSQLVRDMLAKHPLRRPSLESLIERLIQLEIATLDERAEE